MKNAIATSVACLAALLCSRSFGQSFSAVSSFPADRYINSRDMAEYEGKLYMFLRGDHAPEITTLTRFDGTSFREIPLPAGYVGPYESSQLEVLEGKLYMILREEDPIPGPSLTFRYALFSFNGTFTKISMPFPERRISYLNKIKTYNDHLNFAVYDTLTREMFWMTYDGGASFVSRPWPEERNIIPYDEEVYKGKLYKLTTVSVPGGDILIRLLEFDGTTFNTLILPEEDTHFAISGADMEVYNGNLCFPYTNTVTGKTGMVMFDGTNFTYIETPFPANSSIRVSGMKSFNGKLYFVMYHYSTMDYGLYSFDGTSVNRVTLPPGTVIEPFLYIVYRCNLYSTLYTRDVTGYVDHFYTYGPSDGCHLFTVPGRLRDYERITIAAYAPERDWCWTGIDIDWEIHPICPVLPCPDPPFTTTLIDTKGKVVWTKTYGKPFNVSIPLKDVQPYTLTAAAEKDDATGNVFVFDSDLVNKGIENISMDMYVIDEYFHLSVSTDKQLQVPLTISFKNDQGKELWSENLVAPLEKNFSPYISEQGVYFQFSIANGSGSNVSWYPNPVDVKLFVDNRNLDTDVTVSISDLSGKVVLIKDKLATGVNTLILSGVKPGLYVMTIVEGKTIRKELLQVK